MVNTLFPPTVDRRRWLASTARWAASAAAVGVGLGAFQASAQDRWPQRPIQLIVPWPPGGGTDLTVRILAEEAAAVLGHPVVVVNRPGVAGTLVAPLLKAAVPDGYTIGQLPITVIRFALMNRVTWDPMTDLTPILQVSGTTFGLLVAADSPWRSVGDALRWAREHPGALMLGSTGVGSTPHLAMEALMQLQGISYTHVPYKGTADQMLALASGAIQLGMNSTGFAPWVDQGRLRLLSVFSEHRSPRWPQVPTMRELGFEQAVYNSPWGLVAPSGVPAPVLDTLHQAFHRAMFTPRHLQELARYEQSADYLAPADYQRALRNTQQSERQLLQRMKLLAS